MEEMRDLRHLGERITAAIATVTLDMFEHTWEEIDFRLDAYRAMRDAHIEIY